MSTMNPLPASASPGFHLIRWTDDEETHFGAMRVTWGEGPEEWQLIGDSEYFSKSELLDLIGTADVQTWLWQE